MKNPQNWFDMSINDAVSDSLYQHLYRLFTLFSERSLQGTFKPAQAEFLIDELLRELRRPTTPKVFDLPDDVTFNEFLNLLQVIFPEREDLQISTDRVFERYLNHIIGKGFLLFRKSVKSKRGCFPRKKKSGGGESGDENYTEWQFGWCTILPGIIKMSYNHGKKEEIIKVDNEAVIEAPILNGESSIWTVASWPGESVQFSHLDPIQSQIFAKDMRLARDFSTREALADFDYKRSLRSHPSKKNDQKIREKLEKVNHELEDELEEERKNRKDEEIVRGLTTRLLKQEMEKSEHMQQVIYELRSKLTLDDDDDDLPPPPPDLTNSNTFDQDEQSTSEANGENEEISITLPTREEKIQQYAYHLYTTQAEEQVTSDDEEIWKQNYNLIVSTQSV